VLVAAAVVVEVAEAVGIAVVAAALLAY